MKPLVTTIILILLYLTSLASGKDTLKPADLNCRANETVYESLPILTHQDTLNYAVFYKNYPTIAYGPTLTYDALPFINGWADTAVFNPRHYNRFKERMWAYMIGMQLSPLIVEGMVSEISYENTAAHGSNKNFYYTDLSITITDVIKSKYKLKPGDIIQAKTDLYGPFRNDKGKIAYQSEMTTREYEKGKTYLFILDRNHYMNFFYRKSMGFESSYTDTYCPYCFEIGFTTIQGSEDYAKGILTKKDLRRFLSHKHYSKHKLKRKKSVQGSIGYL